MTKDDLKQFLEVEVYKDIKAKGFRGCFCRYRAKLLSPSARICYLIRKMQYHFGRKNKINRLYAMYLHKKIWKESGCLIAPSAVIGIGLHLPHPTGIVIGAQVVIGSHCSIYQHVTLGGARIGDVKKGNQPLIGNHVVIFSGAKVLGKITIGDNCTIGSQALMLTNATANSKWAGIPAKQIYGK